MCTSILVILIIIALLFLDAFCWPPGDPKGQIIWIWGVVLFWCCCVCLLVGSLCSRLGHHARARSKNAKYWCLLVASLFPWFWPPRSSEKQNHQRRHKKGAPNTHNSKIQIWVRNYAQILKKTWRKLMQKKIENRSIQCCLMFAGVLVESLLSFFDHPSRAICKSWKYWCFLAASLFYWIATTLQREAKIIKQGLQNECQKHTSKCQISVLFGVRNVKKNMKKWCKKWWNIGQFSAVWCFASSYRKANLKNLKSRS